MDKTKAVTTTVAFLAGAALGGATLGDIGAKDIDRWVMVQKVCTSETEKVIRSVLAAEACPKLYENHGADCNLDKYNKEVRFDWFKDGDSRSLRMHARFLLPGRFKAE